MEATVLSIHQIFLRRTGNNVYRQLTVCCVLYTFQCALVTTFLFFSFLFFLISVELNLRLTL